MGGSAESKLLLLVMALLFGFAYAPWGQSLIRGVTPAVATAAAIPVLAVGTALLQKRAGGSREGLGGLSAQGSSQGFANKGGKKAKVSVLWREGHGSSDSGSDCEESSPSERSPGKDSESSSSDESSICSEEAPSNDSHSEEAASSSAAPGKASAGKLWSTKEFPEGRHGHANWDKKNLAAAQAWECPCTDRVSCLSPDRLQEGPLYVYRKHFQTTNKSTGGMRDSARTEMEGHFSKETGKFSRSFVIGSSNDNCVAAAGMAKGLSFATWAVARADCRKSEPFKKGRKQQRSANMSHARGVIDAYIRSLRGHHPSCILPSSTCIFNLVSYRYV